MVDGPGHAFYAFYASYGDSHAPCPILCARTLQVVVSHVSHVTAAGLSTVSGAAALLPKPLRALINQSVLPAGLTAGRVPVTIQLRLGKNDAGDMAWIVATAVRFVT